MLSGSLCHSKSPDALKKTQQQKKKSSNRAHLLHHLQIEFMRNVNHTLLQFANYVCQQHTIIETNYRVYAFVHTTIEVRRYLANLFGCVIVWRAQTDMITHRHISTETSRTHTHMRIFDFAYRNFVQTRNRMCRRRSASSVPRVFGSVRMYEYNTIYDLSVKYTPPRTTCGRCSLTLLMQFVSHAHYYHTACCQCLWHAKQNSVCAFQFTAHRMFHYHNTHMCVHMYGVLIMCHHHHHMDYARFCQPLAPRKFATASRAIQSYPSSYTAHIAI